MTYNSDEVYMTNPRGAVGRSVSALLYVFRSLDAVLIRRQMRAMERASIKEGLMPPRRAAAK